MRHTSRSPPTAQRVPPNISDAVLPWAVVASFIVGPKVVRFIACVIVAANTCYRWSFLSLSAERRSEGEDFGGAGGILGFAESRASSARGPPLGNKKIEVGPQGFPEYVNFFQTLVCLGPSSARVNRKGQPSGIAASWQSGKFWWGHLADKRAGVRWTLALEQLRGRSRGDAPFPSPVGTRLKARLVPLKSGKIRGFSSPNLRFSASAEVNLLANRPSPPVRPAVTRSDPRRFPNRTIWRLIPSPARGQRAGVRSKRRFQIRSCAACSDQAADPPSLTQFGRRLSPRYVGFSPLSPRYVDGTEIAKGLAPPGCL